MLSEDGVRRAIVARLDAVAGSCSRAHLDHNDGVFRGLIWVLTGEDPGCYLTHDVKHLLDLAGIPARLEGNHVVHPLPGEPDWPG